MTDVAKRFPVRDYASIGDYFTDYHRLTADAAHAVDRTKLEQGAQIIEKVMKRRRTVFACGNGGSCAISDHLVCDFAKGLQTGTRYRPKVVSLSANGPLVTAIANDITYDDVFIYQLHTLAEEGDLLLTISSSGNSENVVRAIQWAKGNGLKTIALTGFSGGRSGEMADVNIHVAAENYGVVEDIHQSIMHCFAQYLRQAELLNQDEIPKIMF